jgi:hypothetical protein
MSVYQNNSEIPFIQNQSANTEEYFVGSGESGNVYRPPVKCLNGNPEFTYKKFVGKLFDNDTLAQREIKQYEFLEKIDPYKIFTIQKVKHCSLRSEEMTPELINKLKKLKKLYNHSINKRSGRKPYTFQIIFPFGGEPFTTFVSRQIQNINNESLIEKILFPIMNLSFWIGQMNLKNYFHFDIKNDNVLYKENSLYLLDFGLASNNICNLLEDVYYYYVNAIINDLPIHLFFYPIYSPEVNELSFTFYSLLKQYRFNVVSGDAPKNSIGLYIKPHKDIYLSQQFKKKSNLEEYAAHPPILLELREQLFGILIRFFTDYTQIQNSRRKLVKVNILQKLELYTQPIIYFQKLFVDICNIYKNIKFIPMSRKNIIKGEIRTDLQPVSVGLKMVQDSWSYGLTIFYWLQSLFSRFEETKEYSIIIQNTLNYQVCIDYTQRLPLNRFHYLNLAVLSKFGNKKFLENYKIYVVNKLVENNVHHHDTTAIRDVIDIRFWLDSSAPRDELNVSNYRTSKIPPN